MNFTALIIILLVLGVIVSNIMLLKYSSKFNLSKLNQDPIEKAKEQIKQQREEEKSKSN